ncbi:MAG: hypothetical protein KOO60_12875 [Gemmatimonadales bacterium]|nr:hypothetical protein [Gemmatimonadales bacterium]
MKTKVLMAVTLFLLMALSGPTSAQDTNPAPASAEAPDFNGQWILNKGQSQDLTAIMRQAMGGQRGGKSGGRSGGMSGGGGGGRRGGGMSGGMGGQSGGQRPGGSDGDMAKMQERALRMQKEYSRLEIFHEGPEVNLTNGLDISQLHFTDGRQSSIWTERGEMKARTTWKNGSLLIRTSGPNGRNGDGGRSRTFNLSEDGYQLILIEERPLPGKKEPIKIRMVYDRAR